MSTTEAASLTVRMMFTSQSSVVTRRKTLCRINLEDSSFSRWSADKEASWAGFAGAKARRILIVRGGVKDVPKR